MLDEFHWEIIFEPMQVLSNRVPGDKSGLWRVVGRKTGNKTGKQYEIKIFGQNLTFDEAFNLCYEKEKELNP